MKRITLRQKVKPENDHNDSDLLREVVLIQEYFRSGKERRELGVKLFDLLESEPAYIDLTDREHERLLEAAKLEGKSVQPSWLNRLYLSMFGRIEDAEEAPKEKS